MEALIPIAIALVGIFIAWKMLKGLIKTVALVVILLAAAYFVFGTDTGGAVADMVTGGAE